MLTPYDWQEGIGNRAQYIEAKLNQGTPVIAVSRPEGILLFTYRRSSRKLFEVYDRLGFGAIGQQADVEAIRTAAVEFTSREGYQRSEEDVTIQRVASAMSQPIKRAFADFSSAPFVARCLFAEVGDSPEKDSYYILDYTGDYQVYQGQAIVAGQSELETQLGEAVKTLDPKAKAENLLKSLEKIWEKQFREHSDGGDNALDGLEPEAVLIERTLDKEDRFRWLTPEKI